MAITAVVKYRSTDGHIFNSAQEAVRYEVEAELLFLFRREEDESGGEVTVEKVVEWVIRNRNPIGELLDKYNEPVANPPVKEG